MYWTNNREKKRLEVEPLVDGSIQTKSPIVPPTIQFGPTKTLNDEIKYANTGQNGLFILVQLLDCISSEGFKQFLTMENGLAMTRPQKAMTI